MKRTVLITGLCWAASGVLAYASPLTDLSSPSPDVRKKAAEVIRENHLYTPTPREPWDKLVSSIKQSDSLADVLVLLTKANGDMPPLKPSDFPPQGGITLRLDESWAFSCTYVGSQIIHFKLIELPKEVVVPPPSGFSGCWRTYLLDDSPVLHWHDHGYSVGPPETSYGNPVTA